METKFLTPVLSVAAQISVADLSLIAQAGFKSVICNRPDGEGADQTGFSEIAQAAQALGLQARYLPAETGKVSDEQGVAFGQLMEELPKPVLAYCRSGMRSTTMWALSSAGKLPLPGIIEAASRAGYDLKGLVRRIINGGKTPVEVADAAHDVVIIGGGAAGIATAASLLARSPNLDVAIIDPADIHYYQPGWTMVGAGVFNASFTARTMASLLPHGVHWIKAAVAAFEPERNAVILDGCRVVSYQQLVVCPGLKLDWHAVEGLADTLGRNGVTSNYRYDLAPYTWELVKGLRGGRAVFTQPPMPIKCAGAPQKAMYLSADHWKRQGVLKDIDIQFCNAGAVLFGVADYVPALMEYVKAYGIGLNYGRNLVAVDGPARTATFSQTGADGSKTLVTQDFDMLHVVPPQKAPDFIRVSPLADAAGWTDVDPSSLRHRKYANIFALGDAGNTSNAKTAAAARKQAPVVAHNLLAMRGQSRGEARYDGYGSCPVWVAGCMLVFSGCCRPAPQAAPPAGAVVDRSGQLYIEVSALGGLDYFYDHKLGMELAGKALGVKTEYIGPPDYDMAAMVTMFEQAIARKPKGIVVVGFEPSLNAIVDKAVDAGIPVVAVDGDLPGSKRCAFVGTGNTQAGYQGGKKLAALIGGKGQIALMTKPGQLNLEERIAGYRAAMAECPGVSIVQVADTQSDPNVAAQAAATLLQKYPDLAGIGCVEAAGGMGAAMAVREAKKVGAVKIVAMDRGNDLLEQIKDGVVSASVAQQTALMPFYATHILYNLANAPLPITSDNAKAGVAGVPAVIDTGVVIVDASNCQYFMRK